MSIIHCLVARNTEIVLAEYTEHDGNFQQISRLLLRKLRNEKKLTVDYDNYQFHYYKDEETRVSFLCLTEMLSYELAFGFLNDMRKEFYNKYELTRIRSACSYQLQDFEESMKELALYYNVKPSITKSGESISTLSIINNVEVRKIDNIFQVDERMNLVAVNTKVIKKNYQNLNYMDKKIKYQENYKKFKFGILVLAGCIVCLLIIKFLIFLASGGSLPVNENRKDPILTSGKTEQTNKTTLPKNHTNQFMSNDDENLQGNDIKKYRLLFPDIQVTLKKESFKSKTNNFLSNEIS